MVCVKKKNFKSYIRNPAEAALSPSIILIVILEITKREVAKLRKIKIIQGSRFKVQGFFICHIINYTGYN